MENRYKKKQCQCEFNQSEIVVSGISGRFPEAENLDEFWNNLNNGVDMVTDDGRRWSPGTFDLPQRSGKLKELDKFDAAFFSIHTKQANFMDPQLRILMEVTHEAIMDAGVNPAQVRGTRTGVFIGACASESEKEWLKNNGDRRHGYTITGCNRGMFSNRISFAFDFHGPSFTVDTACSSSFIAFEQAVSAIKLGHCDSAIVGGTHLTLEPEMSLQFNCLNMLSPDGKCKSFDAAGNGYVRSEAVAAIFIQKKDVARRSYASILAARTNTDGFKEKGVTFPSGQRQMELLEKTYEEAGINPDDVVYVEAHGTGTPAGDPQELSAIAQVLCKNRDANNPLLIGSVKSNMGHSEPSSGLCGMAKVLLSLQNGIIPANLHFKNPNPNISPLIDGRLKVVTENTPWEGGIVGLNSFGFGGANVHIVLKSEPKKQDSPVTEERNSLPFIIPFSGRTKNAVDFALNKILSELQDNKIISTAATIALLHQIFQEIIEKHPFRGFSLFHGNGQNSVEIHQVAALENSTKRPSTWFIFNGMGSQWLGFAKELFKFTAFAKSIQNSTETLKNNQIDFKNILFSDDKKILDDVTNSFVTITAVQIALVDLLSSLGIKPDGIVGHSVGELGAAYADGCLTLKQTILAALARGQAIAESSSDQKCGMAAVGMSWDEAKSKCPPNVYPACHNSKDSVTISGPLDDIQSFVEQLKTEGIFAKEVASSGRAFHSKYIEYARPKLKTLLDKILPVAKPRSSRWKSTSIPESEWNSDLAQTSSADYHVNNLISPVLFHEALHHVPDSAVVIEIGPHCLLQSILKRSLPACSYIALINKNAKDISGFLCGAIGKMYNCGLNPQFENLYPPVEFPVSCSVPSLSSLISWDHEKSWQVPNFDPAKINHNENHNNPGQTVFKISLSEETDKFYSGHTIGGRIIFPATGYLCLVWKAFAQLQNKRFDHVPVVFENFKIEKATLLQENGNPVKFSVNIFHTTGEFKLVEGGVVIVTGIVRSPNPSRNDFVSLDQENGNGRDSIAMSRADAYKELRLRGYELEGKFKGIFELNAANGEGKLEWLENWVTFLDTLIQTGFLSRKTRALRVPTHLDKFTIDPQMFRESLCTAEGNKVPVFCNKALTIVSCKGIQLQRWKSETMAKSRSGKSLDSLKLERFQFTPYCDDDVENSTRKNRHGDLDLRTCVEVVLENIQINTLKMVQVVDHQRSFDFSDLLAQSIQSQVLQQPSKYFSGKIIANKTGQNENEKIVSESEIPIIISGNEKELQDETAEADLIVMSSNETNQNNSVFSNLRIQNFLLLHNDQNSKSVNVEQVEKRFGLVLVAKKFATAASFFLFKKRHVYYSAVKTVIEIDLIPQKNENDFNYDWVETLKEAMKSEQEPTSGEKKKIFVVSRNSPDHPSGALGLINSLIKEPGGKNIRCFFMQDSDLQLDFDNPDEMLISRLQQDLVHNVFDSTSDVWGSYRFFPLRPQGQPVTKKVEHGFLNIRTKGDLSTFQWLESPLKNHEPQSDLCKVHYAALNFRDVMLCTGKLSPDSLPNNKGLQESVLGIEFSGKTSTGKKIMGYLPNARAFAISVIPDPGFSWDVPDSWTLAEAATAPVVFCTAFYALLIRGKMREGESILIHSGAGGVGQAAIRIALSIKCKVFTTVSSKEKREFLQKKFPQLDDSCFANSRDSSFLNHIMKWTVDKGVDLVLNSLAGDLLQASVKCLRQHGRFLEIGKVDLFNNSNLGMSVLLKDVNVHGILFDSLESGTPHQRKLWKLMDKGINSGVVQPLAHTTFSDSTEEIEKAFRFMASGKHVGKVLIKIHDENAESVKVVAALPRSYFDASKSYIVVGGLGGFGMELCGWLVERGVRKLVIVSRSGVRNGFQDFQIRKWRQVNGASVLVSTADVTTTDGALSLLKAVLEHFNSPIGGIFNLAMVLRDGFMEHQTPENFEVVSRPKVNAAMALDKASRELAPSLEYFVVFTSVASGQGQQGLANYAWANSASERICENRRKSGFPALAIMWGAIGNVGVLQEDLKLGNDAVVGGTSPQPISSCLNVLDVLLHESKSPNSEILVSRVIADKTIRLKHGAATTSASTSNEEDLNLSVKVAHILGMKPEDVKNVNGSAKLHEMGMDSLMQVEIKQVFEMYAGISFNPTEIIQLTFSKILEIEKQIDGETKTKKGGIPPTIDDNLAEENYSSEESKPDDGKAKELIRLNTQEDSHRLNKPAQNSSEVKLESKINVSCEQSSISNEPNESKECAKSHLKVLQKLKAAGFYGLAVVTVFLALLLSFVSVCLRQLNGVYLKLFHDPDRIKIMGRLYDQVFSANPRLSNQIQCIKFSGVPNHAQILKKFEENVINWKTDILLANGQARTHSNSYYKPYELLSWKITSGIFFDYWEKSEDFSMSNHLKFEACPFTKKSGLRKKALKLCESYHNRKWDESKPQWEISILAPDYESNYPEESREFYLIFVSHHSYGDGFSIKNMMQYALRDSRDKHIISEETPEKNKKLTEPPKEKRLFTFHFDYRQKLAVLKNYAARLHGLVLETRQIDEICRDWSNNNFTSKFDSSRHCELRKFDLSLIKAVKNQVSGKRVSVNAVVLTCVSRAYERIYGDTAKNNSNIKLPKNLVALMPFASLEQKKLDMANNFSQSYTAVPTNIPNIHQRLNVIQKSIEDSSTPEKLRTSSDITSVLSSLAKPIARFLMPLLSSPSFVFTSVPATFPKNSTYFGGYRVTEFFGFTVLVSRTEGAFTCTIDSVNDCMILSHAADKTNSALAPDNVTPFFQYFQEQLDDLVASTMYSP